MICVGYDSDPDHPDYHQPTDTYDRCNHDYFVRVCHMAIDCTIEIEELILRRFT